MTAQSIVDENETSFKGRGRGRPRKIIGTAAPIRTATYGRVSEFSLISPPNTKQPAETASDLLKTNVTGLNPEETE